MIIERINKGILLCFFLICINFAQAQGYPINGEKVNFNSVELVNEDVKVISMGGCVSYPCEERYKNVKLVIDFNLADDYADITSSGTLITGAVDVIITANKCSFLGQPAYTLTKHLEIDTDNPRQVFQLDFSSVYLSLDDIEITVDNYSVPVGYESSVNLSVGYEGEFLFPIGYKTIAAQSVNNVDLVTNSAKEFNWTVSCGHYAMYEFQLLKLENTSLTNAQTNDPNQVIADIDWSKALTIHTYSWKKFLRLTLTEGTGYYTWRVRGIGNQYDGAESNPKNWDVWSNHIPNGLVGIDPSFYTAQAHTFYYNQFDEDKNWNYSRVFIEGEKDYDSDVRIGEQIGYANGLLQSKQSQSILNTNQQVVASENVQDYSGRASLNSIPAPVYGQNSLGFKDGFFLSATDGTAYDASDFDTDGNYLEPTAVQLSGVNNGFGYYSDYNTTETDVASAADPLDANAGYPYARTNFYNDGRPKENSGVGFDHRIKNDGTVARTTKMFYGSVSDDELLRVLGNEAPDAGSVHKIVSIDPNKTVRMAYVNKTGQTLFTCLSLPATNDYQLLSLDSQADAIFEVNEFVDPLISTSTNVMERVKNLVLPMPTPVEINYNITTNLLEDYCASFCSSCDYALFVEIIDLETNLSIYSHTEPIDPTTSCTAESVVYTHTESLLAGSYRIVQRLIANNPVSGTLSTQLELHLSQMENYLTDNILGGTLNPTAPLYQIMDYLDNNELTLLYTYLSNHPNATLITDGFGDQHYNFNINDGNGEICTVIEIPVLECEGSQCPTTASEFTDIITDYGYSPAILTYDYAQGLEHTYTADEFEGLITNMILDGYDYCDLWLCWKGIMLNHQNSLDLEVSLNNTPNGAGYNYNPVNVFLDCARGVKYPAGDYPLIAGTTVPGNDGGPVGYIYNAHTHFYYQSGTYTTCLAELDPVGNPGHIFDPSNWALNTNLEMQAFYHCINNIDEGGNGTVALANTTAAIEDACEQACEDKRELFRNEILNLYHSQGAVIEGDLYVYVAQTIAGSVQYVPDTNDPLADPAVFNYSLAEIECAIDVLVEACKGICVLSDPITPAEQANVQNVLTGSLTVSGVDDEGCRGKLVASSEGLPEFLISWDRAEKDEFYHTASQDAAMLDMDIDGSGHVALLAGNKITKYNSGGQVVWSKIYDTEVSDRTIHSIKSIQGGYLISTENYQIARLDGNGNIVWINSYSADIPVDGVQHTSSVEVNTNGDVFVLWYVQNGASYSDVLAKLDLSGNFNWYYEYNAGIGSDFVKAVLCPNGSDIMIGSINGQEVYNISGTGILDWNADPSFTEPLSNIRAIKKIAVNTWVVVGNDAVNDTKLYGVTATGTVSNAGVPMTISGEEGFDAAQTANGNFVVVTLDDVVSEGLQYHATQIEQGLIVWDEYFGSDMDDFNPMVMVLPNGAYIVGGTSAAGVTYPTTYKTETTAADNIWEGWTIKFRHHQSDCHPTEFCLDWTPFNPEIPVGEDPTVFEFLPCEEVQSNYLRASIFNQVATYIENKKTWLKSTYNTQCLIPENIDDELKLTYNMAAYHYMVYYYDRAGNVIKTVPPQGVELQDLTDPSVQNRTTLPKHTHVTDYQYNSLGQMTRSHTPDGGESKFYYDALSRLRFSQDAYQLANGIYSYVKYDALGRAIESGVSDQDAAGQGFLANISNQSYPSSGTSEWTKSVYNTPFGGVEYKGQNQQFLRNRISYVYNAEGAYTYYSYDPHGNVVWVVQDLPNFDRFTVAYDYDLLSGNVLMVSYNDNSENNPDKFYHRYTYDGDNRILLTETSTDKVIWDVDQESIYNSVGMMNRKITGNDQVQGTDYVSTLHGWLKGINHASLSSAKDPGQDGNANTVAEDAFGMILNYYEGDYRRNTGIGTAYTSTDEQYLDGMYDLYDGNISSWTSRIPDQTYGGASPIEHAGNVTGFTYRYDELQRIKKADFQTIDATDATATWTSSSDYHAEYSFDANGNFTNLKRNAYANAPSDIIMDDINYEIFHFTSGAPTALNYEQFNNQLISVNDVLDATDIDDITGANNYTYDEIGRLTTDLAQDISAIEWTAFQKVESITKTTGEIIRFKYDALGNRIAKEFIHPVDPLQNKTTYYVFDASGNCMATYEKQQEFFDGSFNDVYKLTDHIIYAGDRVGLFAPQDVVVKIVGLDGVELNTTVYDRKTELTNWNLSVQNRFQFGFWNIPFITEMNYNSSTQVASNNAYTGGIGTAGKNNAVLEDEFGNLILTVSTHRTYNGVANVSVVRDGNGNMVQGSNYVDGFWNGQSIFVKQPGSSDYYLITINQSGQMKAHRIFVNGFGVLEVSPIVTTISGTYAQGLAVVDDRSGDFETQILAVQQGVSTSALVSIEVNDAASIGGDFGAPVTRQSYAYKVLASNIAISPNGERMAVAAEDKIVFNWGWFSISFPRAIIYNNNYTDYETVSSSTINNVGIFAKCNDISYSPFSNYLFYAKQKWSANGVFRWNLAVAETSYTTINGAVRRGENGDMYVLEDRDTDNNNNITRINSPDGSPTASIQALLPVVFYTNYLKADLVLQPHIIKGGSDENIFTRAVGNKMYELKDHLSNVRAVVTDRKLFNGTNYTAQVVSVADYYPYGMQMPGRYQSSDIYRYGFQGQEKDDEVKGEGNSVNYKYRMHDPRIGRFFAVDPLASKYPHNSPYAFSENKVIHMVELEGLEAAKPKNVSYYNMVRQSDGTYKPDTKNSWSSSKLNVKSDNAIFRNNKTGKEYSLGKNNYNIQDASVGVYTYWNKDGSINRQVVLSSSNTLNNVTFVEPKINALTGEPLYYQAFSQKPQSLETAPLEVSALQAVVEHGTNGIMKSNVFQSSVAYGMTKTPILRSITSSVQVNTKLVSGTNIVGKVGGYGLGLYNGVALYDQYKNGDISFETYDREQASNIFTTFGGIYGAAWGIGWECGKRWGPSTWYGDNDYKYFE